MDILRFVVVVLALGSSGCGSLARPDWYHPGTARTQQLRAQRFDPYAEDEPGPTIVGARPREFQKPLAEPLRARRALGNGAPR
jgi:hypothetical protein